MKRSSVAERLSAGPTPRVVLRLVSENGDLPVPLHSAAGTLLGLAVSVLLWAVLLGAAFWVAG